MSCSRSLSVHLLRGGGALSLLVLGFVYANAIPWLLPVLLIGAIVLLRGCPMCWLIGLFDAIAARRSDDRYFFGHTFLPPLSDIFRQASAMPGVITMRATG